MHYNKYFIIDKGNEHIIGDGTDLKNSGGKITLNGVSGLDINGNALRLTLHKRNIRY